VGIGAVICAVAALVTWLVVRARAKEERP